MELYVEKRSIADAMEPYIEKGYQPRIVTENSAFLVEQRLWSPWWLTFWLIAIPIIGGAIYAGWTSGRWVKTVSITSNGIGDVWVQEGRAPGYHVEPNPITKRTLRKRQQGRPTKREGAWC